MARGRHKSNPIIPWRFALFFGLLAAVWTVTLTLTRLEVSRGLLIAFDVAVTSPHIRKVVTMHCVAGFFFNRGVLALTINILGSR